MSLYIAEIKVSLLKLRELGAMYLVLAHSVRRLITLIFRGFLTAK
jgi:hypothetical protein